MEAKVSVYKSVVSKVNKGFLIDGISLLKEQLRVLIDINGLDEELSFYNRSLESMEGKLSISPSYNKIEVLDRFPARPEQGEDTELSIIIDAILRLNDIIEQCFRDFQDRKKGKASTGEFTLTLNFQESTFEDVAKALKEIERRIGPDCKIRILRLKQGSVKVEFSIDPKYVDRLKELIDKGVLEDTVVGNLRLDVSEEAPDKPRTPYYKSQRHREFRRRMRVLHEKRIKGKVKGRRREGRLIFDDKGRRKFRKTRLTRRRRINNHQEKLQSDFTHLE